MNAAEGSAEVTGEEVTEPPLLESGSVSEKSSPVDRLKEQIEEAKAAKVSLRL